MDLRFVESLLLVAEQRSIAAAARSQNITAAAISQRLGALEAEFGVKLFMRDGRQMAPTQECLALLPVARELLAVRREMDMVLASNQLAGPLRIGAISTALGRMGTRLVTGLQTQASEISLHLVPGTSEEIFESFQQRRIDIALLVQPPFDLSKAMWFQPLEQQEIGLFRRKSGSPQQPYVVYDKTSWGGALCWEALKKLDTSPEIVCEMDAPEVIAQMVRDGLGQAVLPQWPGLSNKEDQTIFEPLGSHRPIGLLSWRKDAQTALSQLVLEILR